MRTHTHLRPLAGALLASWFLFPDAGLAGNLSKNDGSSCCAAIATDGKNVYVAWEDNEQGNFNLEILLSRSTKSGKKFSKPVNVSSLAGDSFRARVAASGGNVYVAWVDLSFSGGNGDILFSRSTDQGVTFSPFVNLSSTSSAAVFHDLAADGDNVYVVWQQSSGATTEVFFTRSTDAGATFSAPVNLSNNAGSSSRPQVRAAGGKVYVAWHDDTGGAQDILFTASADGGASFGSTANLSGTAALSNNLSLAADGDTVVVAWEDFSVALGEILVTTSTDGGASFGAPVNVSNTASGVSQMPAVAVAGQSVHVAWQDDDPGNTDILYARSTDTGASFGTPKNVSAKQKGSSVDAVIAAGGSRVAIAWKDDSKGHLDVLLATSKNGGQSFSKGKNLTKKKKGDSERPAVAISGNAAVIAYEIDIKPGVKRDVFASRKK